MIKLIQLFFILQKKCYEEFKNTNGKIGSISDVDYQRIDTRLKGNTKEFRRFQTDKKKVVIEKNFFLHALMYGEHAYFLLRQMSDMFGNQTTSIKSSSLKNNLKTHNIYLGILIVLLVIDIIFFCFFLKNLPDSFSGGIGWWFLGIIVFLTVVLYFLEKSITKNYEERFSFINKTPSIFFDEVCSSNKNMNDEDGYFVFLTEIIFKSAVLKTKLEKLLKITSNIPNSKIAYLWMYKANVDMLEIRHLGNNDYYGNKISIEAWGEYLIPCIETEYSFIFDIDELEDNEIFESNFRTFDFKRNANYHMFLEKYDF